MSQRNQDEDLLILGSEELQKIFNVYHQGDSNKIFSSTSVLREKNSQIPVLKEKSGFFKCSDDSVYESVLDEIKKEHAKHIKEPRKWHFKRTVS